MQFVLPRKFYNLWNFSLVKGWWKLEFFAVFGFLLRLFYSFCIIGQCYFETRIKYRYSTIRNTETHLNLIGNLSYCSGQKSTNFGGGKIRKIFYRQSQVKAGYREIILMRFWYNKLRFWSERLRISKKRRQNKTKAESTVLKRIWRKSKLRKVDHSDHFNPKNISMFIDRIERAQIHTCSLYNRFASVCEFIVSREVWRQTCNCVKIIPFRVYNGYFYFRKESSSSTIWQKRR